MTHDQDRTPADSTTSDLFDDTDGALTCTTQFRLFGGRRRFAGEIATVACHEDNVLLRETLSGPGLGRVLVVDGGGSLRVALLGDVVATLGVDNGWAGVLVHGAVRDVARLAELDLGVAAVGTNPARSGKTGAGRVGEPVSFGGATFRAGDLVVVDDDGVLVVPATG